MWVMDIVHTASTAGDGYDKMQLRCPFGIWCVVVVLQRERGPGVSVRCIRWGDIIVSIHSSTNSPESSLCNPHANYCTPPKSLTSHSL